MPGQDHDEHPEELLRSDNLAEGELSADMVRSPLSEKDGDDRPKSTKKAGQSLPWGSKSPGDGDVEAVWDEDPTSPEPLIEEVEVEEEEEVDEDGRIRVKKRKGDAEHQWGWEQRQTLWWVLSGLAAVMVVGFFLKEGGRSGGAPVQVPEPSRFVSTTSSDPTPVAELLALGQSEIPRFVEILATAEGPLEEAKKVVVNGSDLVGKMAAWRKKIGPRAAVKKDGVIGLMAVGFGDHDYLLVSGLRDDYTKYVAYYVERDGELYLDWEATEGYCTRLPEDVPDLGENEIAELRVLVSPSSFYTTVYPESDYVCVLLSHFERERYAWGYVRRETPAHLALAKSLSAPVTMMTAGRMRVRVARGPAGSLPKQVEVVEILGRDWTYNEAESAGEGASPAQERSE